VHQIVRQEYIDALDRAGHRLSRIAGQIRALVPDWSLAPMLAAIQAMPASQNQGRMN